MRKDLRDQPWWTDRDQAVFDYLIWKLVGDPSPEAISKVIAWRDARILIAKARYGVPDLER